jgi:CBS domain-containing protein
MAGIMPAMFDFDVREVSDVRSAGGDGDGDVLGFNVVRLDARVTEIPRGPALTLAPETSIATAIEAMRQRRRGSAIIVRNQRPVGVVSDRDLVSQACGDIDDLRAVPVSALMAPATDPLREHDSVGTALRKMCAQRQWHQAIVCARGLFVGALDIADVALWLRDRLTMLSLEAAFPT